MKVSLDGKPDWVKKHEDMNKTHLCVCLCGHPQSGTEERAEPGWKQLHATAWEMEEIKKRLSL